MLSDIDESLEAARTVPHATSRVRDKRKSKCHRSLAPVQAATPKKVCKRCMLGSRVTPRT